MKVLAMGRIVDAAIKAQRDSEMMTGASREAAGLLEAYKAGDAKCVSCAECNCEMLAKCHAAARAMASEADKQELPPIVAGYIKGRPYCMLCID